MSFKYVMRYHIGSIAMGSLLRIANFVFLRPVLSRIAQCLKGGSVSICKVLCIRMCFCVKYYNTTLRYIGDLNYTFLSIFAEDYVECGKKAYHLMRRNYVRIGKPAKIGGFIIGLMKWVVVLSGVCMNLVLILFPRTTPSGQLTVEVTGVSGSLVFVFVISWFVGEVFGGALEVSLNTVLLSAACDEEMFTREQRFIEADLLEFMDGIGEEQNENHRENKKNIRIASQSTNSERFSMDEGDERTGVSRIVPENSWKSSKNVSRVHGSENSWGRHGDFSRVGTTESYNARISPYDHSRIISQDINFAGENSLERIQEVSSFEEDPVITTYGNHAKYVD